MKLPLHRVLDEECETADGMSRVEAKLVFGLQAGLPAGYRGFVACDVGARVASGRDGTESVADPLCAYR